MKKTVLILLMAASTVAASAQNPAKPASPAAKTATTTAKTAKPSGSVVRPAGSTVGVKLPPGVPAVKGIVKSAFTMRYEDIKIGTGAAAEPNKLYKVHYTGWLAADGRKFDSSYDHPRPPVLDKDGKPILDANGKPKLGEPQPIVFPQGARRVIAGWEVGFEGMKVGGKRRLFIPYQLAYGELGHPSSDPKNPGIPGKADMIFDVELVDVVEMQMPANHPGMGGMNGMGGMPAGHAVHAMPASPDQPGTAAKPAAQAAPTSPAQPK
jgi:peptidylprolyl isomerase